MSYLLDTNVLSELVKAKPSQNLILFLQDVPDELLNISIISLGEIRKGVEKLKTSKKKESLRTWLEHELPQWFEHRILLIDFDVVDTWGRLQAQSKRTLPAIDSLIAATAITHHMRLVTRNEKDFQYSELEVINPW